MHVADAIARMLSPRLAPWRRAFAVLALLSVVFPTMTARAYDRRTDFDETVIGCEDALARLQRCCPDFDPHAVACIDDEFEHSGCGAYTHGHTLPAYTKAESTCIREMACDDLIAKGVCKRAAAIHQRGFSVRETEPDGGYTSTSTTDDDALPAVCP